VFILCNSGLVLILEFFYREKKKSYLLISEETVLTKLLPANILIYTRSLFRTLLTNPEEPDFKSLFFLIKQFLFPHGRRGALCSPTAFTFPRRSKCHRYSTLSLHFLPRYKNKCASVRIGKKRKQKLYS
jgi:hypothetical protein